MFDVNKITHNVINQVLQHYRQIGQHLYENGSCDSPESPFQSSPLSDEIRLLVRVANGEFDRTTADDEVVGEVMETLQQMIDLLFSRSNGPYNYTIPSSFWLESDIGQVFAHVQAWLRQDDLISYTDAAQILFETLSEQNIQAARMRIKRLVQRGKLMSYVALDEANPTRQMRVSRQAVEALLAADMAKKMIR